MLIFVENVNPFRLPLLPLAPLTSPLRHTLRRAVTVEGVGAHTGARVAARLSPLDEPRGVLLGGEPVCAARVVDARFATTLELPSGARLQTVEHLLAALWCAGVDDARVEVWALEEGGARAEGGGLLELPILDGSAAPWSALLDARPTRPASSPEGVAREWRALPPISLRADRCALTLSPEPLAPREGEGGGEGLPLTLSLRFSVREELEALGLGLGEGEEAGAEAGAAQRVEARAAGDLARLVLPARTFGFESHAPLLRARGLIRGVSLENTIPLSDLGAPRVPLRHPDELAGHKLLDLLGDLALTGGRWRGHIHAERGGHHLNALLVEALRRA